MGPTDYQLDELIRCHRLRAGHEVDSHFSQRQKDLAEETAEALEELKRLRNLKNCRGRGLVIPVAGVVS